VFCIAGVALADIIPDATNDGILAVRDWATRRLHEAETSFNASRLPSPDTWSAEVVYQIQVDRFNNGDLSNDNLNLPPEQASHQSGDPEGLPNYRHGGDLKGIIDRLGYLADMRVSTLWITPIFQHNGEYHGYCTTDPTKLDPGFGTPELLRSLVADAHALGMRVVLDVVVNHLCDRNSGYSTPPANHVQCATDRDALYWSGQAGESGNAGNLSFGPGFFPALRSQHFFNRCGPDSTQEMQAQGAPAVFGDFTSQMFDYDTLNQDFQVLPPAC
jgi:hypothetical protein